MRPGAGGGEERSSSDLTSVKDRQREAWAAGDRKAPTPLRLKAIALLGRGLDRRDEDVKRLTGLLTPQTSEALRIAAVAALGRLREVDVPGLLLRGWGGYGPGLRLQVLDVLFRRDDWQREVLTAVEKKRVQPFEIDTARRQRLREPPHFAFEQQVGLVLIDGQRQPVVGDFRAEFVRGDVIPAADEPELF